MAKSSRARWILSNNNGLLHLAHGNTDLAMKYLNQSLTIRIKQGSKVDGSYDRKNLGLVFEN